MGNVLVRGSGDVASAMAHRLCGAGHAVAMHDRPRPPRRRMVFTDALFDGIAAPEDQRSLAALAIGLGPNFEAGGNSHVTAGLTRSPRGGQTLRRTACPQ